MQFLILENVFHTHSIGLPNGVEMQTSKTWTLYPIRTPPLHYRGSVSAATFRAEELGSEPLLTGFFWSSFLGVELARFFFPRAFRLWIPKWCKGVLWVCTLYATFTCPNFHFSVSPHVPFLNLLFEQIANSNEYLLAKIGVDTAENEPLKVWRKTQFIFHSSP